jgi:hypothetical protein
MFHRVVYIENVPAPSNCYSNPSVVEILGRLLSSDVQINRSVQLG